MDLLVFGPQKRTVQSGRGPLRVPIHVPQPWFLSKTGSKRLNNTYMPRTHDDSTFMFLVVVVSTESSKQHEHEHPKKAKGTSNI